MNESTHRQHATIAVRHAATLRHKHRAHGEGLSRHSYNLQLRKALLTPTIVRGAVLVVIGCDATSLHNQPLI
jgi:hypothetical protein